MTFFYFHKTCYIIQISFFFLPSVRILISLPFKTHTIFLYCNFLQTKEFQIIIVADKSTYDTFDTLEALVVIFIMPALT